MEIRFAQSRDIPGLLRLLEQVGEVHHRLRPDIFRSGAVKYDASALEALLQDPDRPVFVAEVEGDVGGYCFCVRKEIPDSHLLVGRQELYIDDLCVEETLRRRGIAKALSLRAVAYAKSIGCQTLTLNVWQGNTGAQHFYEQMGLRPRNILMELPLEESEC